MKVISMARAVPGVNAKTIGCLPSHFTKGSLVLLRQEMTLQAGCLTARVAYLLFAQVPLYSSFTDMLHILPFC